MKGHIRQRGNASWAVVVDDGQHPNGSRRQKWIGVKGTKRDAERELGRILVAVNGGGLPEAGKTTVGEHLARWLKTRHRIVYHPRRCGTTPILSSGL